MTTTGLATTTLLIIMWASGTASAWGHANRWGGGTAHMAGVGTVHRNTFGGGTAHSAYGGTAHMNAAGGTTVGRYGAGAVHTTPYGATAYHPPGAYYGGYHPPVTAGYYGANCFDCGGGWATAGAALAGGAIGAAAGAAVASSNAAVATTGAYAAGVAAGAAYAPGAMVVTLPAGCVQPDVQGQAYYLCGNTWFRAAYGANGMYYTVVPAP